MTVVLEGSGSREVVLSLKGQAKFLLRRQKLYHITNVFCTPLRSVFIESFDINLLTPRNPWIAEYLQSPINYSNSTHILPLYFTLTLKASWHTAEGS